MPDNDGLLFILGAGKTASTSLCGLLNSHPDVFMMCEVFFNQSQISRYGGKLLKACPELLPCFFRGHDEDDFASYRRAHDLMRQRGHAKTYFGDKFVGIDSDYAGRFKDVPVIFSARRLPEWIAKDSVRGWYPMDADAAPFAIQYAKHFIESFLLPRVFHVRMDEFLGDNAAVVRGIWDFLGVEPPAGAQNWWETIGHYPPGDPKQSMNWWRGHASSAVAPQENDTRIQIRRNPMWDEVLPIFDKYYEGGRDRRFARAEIEADLARLQSMVGRHHQPFESCFMEAASQSRNAHFKEERRRSKARSRTKISRILRTIGIR